MESKDPVCGMAVDPVNPRGGSLVHAGKTYGFCNPVCRDRFAAEPARFLQGSAGRSWRDFAPLLFILGVVLALTALAVWRYGRFDRMHAMRHFEGYFFVVFAGFKLLNWRGFVDAYGTYDLLARRSRAYGWAYPLIELALGAGYLLEYRLILVSWITLGLMVIGAVGVARALGRGQQIPCACLGTVFKIPMTWVTFVEDLVMAVMAAGMIAMLA